MKPEKAISLNVKRIRASRGMTQTATAKAAGISRQAYIDIEKGKTKEPRVGNLQAIAGAFDVQIMDLLAEPPKLSTVRFRNNSMKTKKDNAKREQCLVEAACWLKNFNFLQSVVGEKKEYILKSVLAKAGDSKTTRPIVAAESAREVFGLKEDEPIGDIVGLIESAGIKIKLAQLDIKKFFGFSASESDGGPAIIVNTDKEINIERQIFTIAHELGHLILHPQAYDPSQTQESDCEESEANVFAGYFLMPKNTFEKKLSESYGLGFVERVLHIKRFFRVSYLTILHRMAEMKIAEYGALIKQFNILYKKYGESLANHKEPCGLDTPDVVEDYLSTLVRKALEKNEITVSRAAEILNVPLMDMREIINSWADIAA
ncbi:MAG: DNA-binding protein [Planctomycetota bacterium]|nr:MAG: DNA-binding protein [Planctomycetota bacterium]